MLTKTVTYTDFNDIAQTETLYFNLSRIEFGDLIDLQPELEKYAAITSDPKRTLTNVEILELLNIIERVVRLAYGQRSGDGRHFRKSAEIYNDFKDSAVYDAFIMGLFENGGQPLSDFLVSLTPKEWQEPTVAKTTETAELPEEDTRPAYIRENREPTQLELQKMTPAELQEAFRRKGSQ